MSYQVIARKYRPQRFSDVVGQDHVTQTLSHAIEQKRIAHAYLFCGPRGTGKTTVARIFAKCLNAAGGPRVDFDDNDPIVKEITEGRSLDVIEIDGASNRGIDEIRGLRETVKYVPAVGKFKVYIIDEVHMLTEQAFNALLKTLEEPPEHVKFLFATTDPEKVLPTILSRCQRFDLRRIPAALIVKQLAEICVLEKVKADAAALHAIARGAEGGMRDAESTLDQLISFCGDTIEEPDVLSMFGLTAQRQLLGLATAILRGEVETALRQLNELAGNGKDLARLLSDLLNHFRNLLIFQVSRGDLGMLEVSEGEAAALAEQAALASAEGLTRMLDVFGSAEMRLRDATSKKILVEVTLLKAIEARNALSLDAVLKQLQALREGRATAAPIPAPVSARPAPAAPAVAPRAAAPQPAPAPRAEAASAPRPAPAVVPTPEPPTVPAEASGDLGALWSQLLEGVRRAKPVLRSYLTDARPLSFNNRLLTIGFDPEFADYVGLVDDPQNRTLLQTKLAELGHPGAQFKFVKADPDSPPPAPVAVKPEPVRAASSLPPAPSPQGAMVKPAAPEREKPVPVPFDPNDFKNDPLIQKALDVFKGQIVEVRA